MSTTRRVVRERIDPRLTASLFANYRSASDALLELVDNAVDARIDGQPMVIDLTIRPGSVSITAVGGSGMSPRQLERDYLHWGASPKRGGGQIGRYGQGGKAAIGHLGNRFEVIASAAGDDRAHAFEDDDYRDRSRLRAYDLHDRAKPVDPSLGYVHIAIGQVDKKLDPERLRTRLGEVYRPLLQSAAIVLRVNRAPAQPASFALAEQERISVRAGGRLIQGWWGLLDTPTAGSSTPGIRIYHLGRLVGDPAWFGHQGPALHPGLARLVGEIELPHVPVTMNKSDVDRDSPEWAAVETRLHRLLAPVVRRLTREDGPVASPQALRVADQVRRILARALRLLESGALFESPHASGAEGPEGQLTFEQVRMAPEGDTAPGDEPASETGGELPEPPDAGVPALPSARSEAGPPGGAPGKQRGGGSRRGFGDVVIRSLDPRVRSAMVQEDGVRRVVINSQYPYSPQHHERPATLGG